MGSIYFTCTRDDKKVGEFILEKRENERDLLTYEPDSNHPVNEKNLTKELPSDYNEFAELNKFGGELLGDNFLITRK